MTPVSFRIQNYKGIKDIQLDLSKAPRANVFTLVGLNESGKTTILEAINKLRYRIESLDLKNIPGYHEDDVADMVPVSERGNFTGAIEIEAQFDLSWTERFELKKHLIKNCNFTPKTTPQRIQVVDRFIFANDVYVKKGSGIFIFGLVIDGKFEGQRKTVRLDGEHWTSAAIFLKPFIPAILYFPNFLFEFPTKICLEPDDDQTEKFYAQLVADMVSSYDATIDIQKHLVERAKSEIATERRSLNGLLLKIGQHISNLVFGAWFEVFERKVENKEITLDLSVENDKVSISFAIKDGDQVFELSERSLGFRWFFAFFLFTQFRTSRKDKTRHAIYLFDEPASNLHAAAQSRLLKSFQQLAQDSTVIYSTHSHHLINPDWLEGAYVIKNDAVVYDDVDVDFEKGKTEIKAVRYREFAGTNPNQTSYYQPVLEALAYAPSKLEMVPEAIMVEGKNDYYTLRYFALNHGSSLGEINLIPGGGAGSLDSVIQLYLGWGRNFTIILDGDSEGEIQKARYLDKFGFDVQGKLHTLGDIDIKLKEKKLEDLFTKDDKELLRLNFAPNTPNLTKTQFNRSIQELLQTGSRLNFSEQTVGSFTNVLNFLTTVLNDGRL
jgi:hypothetical protein